MEAQAQMYILLAKDAYASTLLSKQQAKAVKQFIQEQFGKEERIHIRPVEINFDVSEGQFPPKHSALVSPDF